LLICFKREKERERKAEMGFLNLNDKHKEQIGLLNGFDASSRYFNTHVSDLSKSLVLSFSFQVVREFCRISIESFHKEISAKTLNNAARKFAFLFIY
jgi:hypothetical protein